MNLEPRFVALVVSASLATLPAFAFAHQNGNEAGQREVATKQLTSLIEAALSQDGNRTEFSAKAQAMRANGIASATLMDPKLKVGVGGLPVDSFQFDKDPMTNISVGLMQQFERGSTLELKQKQANQQADGLTAQIEVREREVANQMTQLWLELGYLQHAQRLLDENRRLMVEMEQYLQTNYSIGKSEAQDLLNAQLQVNKLDEKLQANRQQQSRIVAQLSEWLGSQWLDSASSLKASNQLNWAMLDSKLDQAGQSNHLYPLLNQHPMIKMAELNVSVNQTQVEMAEQAYTPQFGVEVMYAYRQANGMNGQPASDLVSAYLTMDIPLFTGNRQDNNLAAAQYQVGAALSQKDTLLAQMNAQANALLNDRSNLNERIERYQSSLIPQASSRTEAVERGYQNNTAQFSDVISATTDELALQLELERLMTDWNRVSSQLAALLGGFEYQITPPAQRIQN
ncbi:TolC family protein [Vibrio sp. TRT 1302]|uniref:TolC family protein n=1 Tax=Vibrio sp. TRT 1302 TaxID=3418504 RepID=UPI003CEBD215